MNDLREMWEIGGLVADQNNDQVPDQVNVSIRVKQGVYPEGLIDFCARLGFETTGLSFDFLQQNNRYKHTLEFEKSNEETAIYWESNQFIVHYQDKEKLSTLLRFLAGVWHHDFLEVAEPVEEISLGEIGIRLRTKTGKFHEIGQNEQKVSVSSKVYQIHSLTDIWNDLGFSHQKEASPKNEHAITFQVDEDITQVAWMEIYYGASRIGMESTSLYFPLTGEASKHPLQFCFHPNTSGDASIELVGNTINFSGEDVALSHAIAYFFREKHWSFGGHFASWEKKFKKIPHENKRLFQFLWEDEGEVAALYECLEGLRTDATPTHIHTFISESQGIRNDNKAKLQKKYPKTDVLVRSAFKPGYFWITEEILPRLMGYKDQIGSIRIACLKEEKRDGLELPIRWIQELYPVDEIIAKILQIETSAVTFTLDEKLDATYRITVVDLSGNPLLVDDITIPVSKVPYVEDGKYSYPTTSLLSVWEADEVLIDTVIQTDRERFYMYYLEHILPKLWKEAQPTDEKSGILKPLFDRIEIEVEMSEGEMKIPVAEERISSLEAMHEDIYFNTLDFFAIKGEQSTGTAFSAPGGVYPFMRVKAGGKPTAKITVYKWLDQAKKVITTTSLHFDQRSSLPKTMEYRLNEEQQVRTVEISHHVEKEAVPCDVPRPESFYLHKWLADYSYRGEPIFVYECMNDCVETYYSAIKLSVYKPTILIETGHHANEVSSSPAVVELLDDITHQYPEIMNHMNLVIIPRANPDGTALHQKMIKDNPEWKHHAARYNAVGLEYSNVRYDDSIFGEANIVPKIMNRWAPDMIIDNHGIPSHEWTQPFAGYHIPPRFNMSFWIPNALVYGIARKLDEEKYPKHAAILDKITDAIQRNVRQTAIHDLNKYWMERYVKYGHQFMPELFPIELTADFIFYKWSTERSKTSTNAISRFPEWVSADLISEAADETVYGESLEICKEAQKLFNLGAISWINKDDQYVEISYQQKEISISRMRPLRLIEKL